MEQILVTQSDIDELRKIAKTHRFTFDVPKKHARKMRRIIRRNARKDRANNPTTVWDGATALFGIFRAMTKTPRNAATNPARDGMEPAPSSADAPDAQGGK